ncbi:protein PHOTOPERIOD-INDEPENDENT EARLY FLOWERING 1-like [Aristolochia californica]|uniref:protein PHOTOPERIOD-INDEPENDENT EARLY FLOWERING 1-like n=1 Tax=Aristolochia californica TaxID=171875 RepID=UPI0035D74CF3
MASKGPRSKLEHDTRVRRQKALEGSKEPPRPKVHWDHVLEEMVWLSKDFEAERKWKLAQAKKVAIRASKGMLDQATRGEKKIKEEEQRLKKVALGISKDVKKFWMKIEKLVIYKHQLELEERKKKTLDKQLDFLLGQTERYSTMLAENLVDLPYKKRTACLESGVEQLSSPERKGEGRDSQSDHVETDGEYGVQSEDESEDDEHTIEEDETLITEEERKEELAALQDEVDLPLEELLKRYTNSKVSREGSPEGEEEAVPSGREENLSKDSVKQVNGSLSQKLEKWSDGENLLRFTEKNLSMKTNANGLILVASQHCAKSNGEISSPENQTSVTSPCHSGRSSANHKNLDEGYSSIVSGDEMDDKDYFLTAEDDKDDETTLSEEEELAKGEADDPVDEIKFLQQESEMSVEELLTRYKKDIQNDEDIQAESECTFTSSEDQQDEDRDGQEKLADEKVVVEGDKEIDEDVRESENIIADAAAAARSAQPTGNTFLTTKVRTKFPFLLKFPLREYQHIGLDWLVTMYEKRLNGILADEMGLGKTIMTIAVLAHLACEKGIWGPHLIVVPTSVMLNWETEFLKWSPAFKILTYFGSAKERKLKRQGWLKSNSFHVCITTYRLVIQDSKVFKRKKWKYLILDEAHLIKNWKSQRWQTLLNFNSKRRILLTGTPLQNDLMELWSLMHFLMPHIFQSHQEFKDWFSNPISGMVEGQEKVNKEVVDRLHNVLRPFILRRLKRDVEKQLPKKYEHVVYCRLSKRQRSLYEDFIASSETQATLASGNFFGMISIIMQLRKVCNHPNLFEGRPIISSFDMIGIDMQLSSSACTILSSGPFSNVDLNGLSILFTPFEFCMTSWEADELAASATPSSLIKDGPGKLETLTLFKGGSGSSSTDGSRKKMYGSNIFDEIQKALWEERVKEAKDRAASIAWWNSLQCRKKPVYGRDLREFVSIKHPVFDILEQKTNPSCYLNFSSKLADIILSPVERFEKMVDLIESFMFAIPAARAPFPVCWCSKVGSPAFWRPSYKEKCTEVFAPLLSSIRPAVVRRQVYFPDRRLIQFDCGKLQELAVLLRCLKSEGHRALIFTQMTKMLDILEAFINLYGYTYMRLDGSTQPEERQTLMQRFNTNPKIFLFILSTRSGGVGINLVGADTVIFYDSDWNPAMDQQAQDRCHRIGQTREVHIYRLISDCTIEENILKKANQKRALDDLVIQSGGYNTEFFKKLDPMELFSGHRTLAIEKLQKGGSSVTENFDVESGNLSSADVEAALKHIEDEADYMALKKVEQEEAVDNQEFTEDAIGRLEDDEFVHEYELKPDEKNTDDKTGWIVNKEIDGTLSQSPLNEDSDLLLSRRVDDVDMLADVKQMAAAAAAAGQASSAFENQLRPIDRYTMRFLDLWDPIIDKSAIEIQVAYEEEEWELDRIERFKEDMEAEIDEDEEPLVYERWDADFATEAYRKQVEVLAQRQLLEELEAEAKETEGADAGDENVRGEAVGGRKRKSKKKLKKTKFKSLRKGALTSESEALADESPIDPMSIDGKVASPDRESSPVTPALQKKRKKAVAVPEEEKMSKKISKKMKKASETSSATDPCNINKMSYGIKDSKSCEGDIDIKLTSRSKTGGKISITAMPVKRVLVIKPEKLKKKRSVWSKECIPPPDAWSTHEDAILCAVVHEYCTNWSLVSDTLYGMPGGGFYRGRYRFPVHCCERFRELCYKYVVSVTENPNNEKVSSSGAGKALLKVSEDHVRTLLDVASELPDSELLLQKHFKAVISSVWRSRSRSDRLRTLPSASNNACTSGRFLHSALRQLPGKSSKEIERVNFVLFPQNRKLVATALDGAYTKGQEESIPLGAEQSEPVREQLEVTLEIQDEQSESRTSLPSVVSVVIHNSYLLESVDEPSPQGSLLPKLSCRIAENRLRIASNACSQGEVLSWASSAFPADDTMKSRSSSKMQFLGKHKPVPDSIKPPKSKILKVTETSEDSSHMNKSGLLSALRVSPDVVGDTSFLSLNMENEDIFGSANDNFLEERFDSVPHHYDPCFIMGLDDDCNQLTKEILDIG